MCQSSTTNDCANCHNTDYCYNSADGRSFTTSIARVSQVFAISVLLLLCLAANSLMIYAVLSTRCRGSMLSASSLLLINLATADLLVGTLVLPMWIVSTCTLSWPLPEVLCELTAFLTVALMVCSILSLSAIAVDRWLNLAYPLRYPTEVTPTRLVIVFLCLWCLCFLVAGLPLCGWGQYSFQPQTVPICNPVWVSEVGYAIFLMLGGLTLPFFIMLAAYIKIVIIARSHLTKIEATRVPSTCSLQGDATLRPETAATDICHPPEVAASPTRNPPDNSAKHDSRIFNIPCQTRSSRTQTNPTIAVTLHDESNYPASQTLVQDTQLTSNSSTKSLSSSTLLPSVAFVAPQNKVRSSLTSSTMPPVPARSSLTSESYLSPDSANQRRRKRSAARSSISTGWVTKRVFSKSVNIANRVFVAVGLFFLCWGPYVILNFWSVNHEHMAVPYSADLLTTLLAFSNSAINPVLFLLINKDYRKQVRLLGRKCCRCLFYRDQVQPFKRRSLFLVTSAERH